MMYAIAMVAGACVGYFLGAMFYVPKQWLELADRFSERGRYPRPRKRLAQPLSRRLVGG